MCFWDNCCKSESYRLPDVAFYMKIFTLQNMKCSVSIAKVNIYRQDFKKNIMKILTNNKKAPILNPCRNKKLEKYEAVVMLTVPPQTTELTPEFKGVPSYFSYGYVTYFLINNGSLVLLNFY